MTTESSMHSYVDWTKERLDEIDANLASFESSAAKLQTDARTKAEPAIAHMRAARDAFREAMKQQSQATEAALAISKKELETKWTAFEADVQTYLDVTDKHVNDQQAAFMARAAAQSQAWQDAIDKLQKSTASGVAQSRDDIEKVVKHMTDEAGAAKVKLDQLNKAGGESWTAMRSALSETRAALDRAQQTAIDAFKHAM
jgi:hypothetical protein